MVSSSVACYGDLQNFLSSFKCQELSLCIWQLVTQAQGEWKRPLFALSQSKATGKTLAGSWFEGHQWSAWQFDKIPGAQQWGSICRSLNKSLFLAGTHGSAYGQRVIYKRQHPEQVLRSVTLVKGGDVRPADWGCESSCQGQDAVYPLRIPGAEVRGCLYLWRPS